MDKPRKYSKDGLCRFDPSCHKYHIGNKELPGVTGIIGRYKNKFDKQAESARYAKKLGIRQEDVLAEWDAKGKAAIEQGNAVHTMIEDFILNGTVPAFAEPGKLNSAAQMIQDLFLTERLKPIEAELLVHNGHIASQIDCIAQDQLGRNYILDWKTNKDISRDSWGKQMLAPFDQLPDATFYHYSLQVGGFYRALCTDIEIHGAYIVHITETGYDFIKPMDIQIPKHILENAPIN